MQLNKALNKILAQEGVSDVFIMDGAVSVRMELEESKNSGPGCRYENRGLEESRSRDLKVCVFSDGFLETPTEMMTVMTFATSLFLTNSEMNIARTAANPENTRLFS